MPQLAIETFVTQYFWLVVTLGIFYYFIAGIFIPQVSAIIKTRSLLSAPIKESSLTETTNTLTGKTILSQALSLKSAVINTDTNYKNRFKKVNKVWITKMKKGIKPAVKKSKKK